MNEVEYFNAHFKDNETPLKVDATGTAMMYGEENRRQNYGYKFLSTVYDMLDIDGFIADHLKSHRFKGKYSPADIFRFLVLMRILSPDSKRATCQTKDTLYGMETDFTLQNVYDALDQHSGFEIELQRHLNEKVKTMIGRDLTHAFYDVTNYFCEIDFNDEDGGLRFRGVSKEHRVDPIVGMGLFMDRNGLPVCMSIFPGNKSEKKTLEPTMKDVKKSYGLGRLVVVADKGLNSGANIDMLVNGGDGFVFSQVLKGTYGKRYQEKLFDPAGWTENLDGSYRYKLFEEDYDGRNAENRKVTRKRKVLLYWSKADADMACRKREEKLRKAEKTTKNNLYGIKKGQDEYIKEDIVVRDTGEYLEAKEVRKKRSVNREKAAADAAYDGYFCIITSETEMDEKEIRKAYGGLWRIEQSFRILKSDLYARPIFLYNPEHIRAHFLICFTALLIVRIIQYKMGEDALSAERIATALGCATCRVLKGGIVMLDDVGGMIAFKKTTDKRGKLVDTLEFSSEDQIALDYKRIQAMFGTDFYNVYSRQEVFNRFLKSIVLA
jgi:transposase